jgi:ATP-dependent exoDNAse (exonuclease V) beta subunit
MPDPKTASATAPPPDHAERSRALDPSRSFLVQAPAGSGKTYLLTQRFLRLLAQAEQPDEIVAITFTNAAAAEMRNRVLSALENAQEETESHPLAASSVLQDPESLPALAARALEHASRLGWQILDQPSQLRITTIDAFCRGLALQSPLSWGGLLAGLGGRLDPVESPADLYRRAATRTIELLKTEDSPTRRSVEAIMRWRDNNWKDVENLIVEMLAGRNRWYQEFVFARDEDWGALRNRLEAPFRRAARGKIEVLHRLLDGLPESREFALTLARFACETPGKFSPLSLAERVELPVLLLAEDGSSDAQLLEDAIEAYRDLACFLLTTEGEWRKRGGLNVNHGFPATPSGKAAKDRFAAFVDALAEVPGLQAALAVFQKSIPVRYTDNEWNLIRDCFAILRHAAAQLQLVFAETGSVDFTEVAQIALRILAPENGFPSDFALRQADSIRHLLIDEFQDTSRSQHELLSRLIAAWPAREGRSCFCVGDPMQSIYSFREAEVELFERARTHGLETASGPDSEPLRFDFVPLRANFRTVPSLVKDLNGHFSGIFAQDDGSGIGFSPAEAARESHSLAKTELHLAFTETGSAAYSSAADPEATRQSQLNEIVALIRSKLETKSPQNAAREKFRIAVLARTRNSLIRIAESLRQAGIGFRAIDLVPLGQRPEVLDALSLARALLNPTDRTAWLAILRAPWCGLTLEELHLLTSGDETAVTATPIPTLLASRLPMLFEQRRLGSRAFAAASRVERVLRIALETRSSASNQSLGTWLESVWKALGGGDTVDASQRENLRLLWTALDGLPEGEVDLLGPGLKAALDKLCAQPDPSAGSDFGVQLMTIHKSKGLEFEVVLVPDLEAESRKGERAMISWLERGLADPGFTDSGPSDPNGQLTEFLIAPIQAKGADASAAKTWVDSVKRERERQELRRLLYVAATRAREELHLFARPRYRISTSGEASLCNPTGLLATAWPAFGGAIESRFEAWLRETTAPVAGAALTLAAQSENPAHSANLLQMPAAAPTARPTRLRRLPENYTAPDFRPRGAATPTHPTPSLQPEDGIQTSVANSTLFARTEGGLRSRVLGTAIHTLLEQSSRLRRSMTPAEAAQALADFLPAIAAGIRTHGLPRAAAERLAREALTVAQRSSLHPIGAWILSPHPESHAEARWTGFATQDSLRGRPFNLRPDRVFFASSTPPFLRTGPESPLSSSAEADPAWWIIDYKTAHAEGLNLAGESGQQSFLAAHRAQFSAQLAAYAQVLRSLRASQESKNLRVRAGVFYPRLHLLDFWEA